MKIDKIEQQFPDSKFLPKGLRKVKNLLKKKKDKIEQRFPDSKYPPR